MIALALYPAGYTLSVYMWGAIPPWALTVLVLSFLGLLYVYIGLSMAGLFPSKYAPWTLSKATLWLDKTCMSQETNQTVAAGTAAFDRLLKDAHGMIAFVSPNYFRRVWCVFELARFCILYQKSRKMMKERLILLNLQWPGILWPFKNTELTAEEKMWFEKFSLKETSAFKPSDKAEVLEKISQMWGKPENFEEFVKTELVDIFAESKRRYAHQIRRIALSALETTFGG